MKILITGAYGFVGTNLCRYLAGKGHECHALDIPAAKRDDVPYAAFFTWDALAGGEMFPAERYDAVVHLAGKAHDLKKVASEQNYFDINVGLTEKIFNAVQGKTERFVYFSSSKAAADGNAYGRSKQAAEEFLGGRAIVLRPAMIHGPGNKGNLNLLWGLAKRGLPWPLAAFENKRSFASVGNVCAAVEALCERGVNGVYPVADDEMLSTNRLIELIAEACGKRARLWKLPKLLMKAAAKVGDILHLPLNTERLGKLTEDSFVDNSELKKLLGWEKMPIVAEDGMGMTLESFSV
jgi:nucleoside-diphosphate-sugar epimerase